LFTQMSSELDLAIKLFPAPNQQGTLYAALDKAMKQL
jgi:hypothetical protein